MIRFSLLASLLLLLSALSAKTFSQAPSWEYPAWKKWKDKYASSSPLQALNKTKKDELLKVSPALVEQVLQGKTRLQFDPPLKQKGKEIKEYDLLSSTSARRLEVHDQIDLQSTYGVSQDQAVREITRFADMKAHMLSLIEARKKDELLILYVGAEHALDLYFSYFLLPKFPPNGPKKAWRKQTIYASHPIGLNTKLHTKKHYEFLRARDGVNYPEEQVEENSLYEVTFYLARMLYYYSLKEGLFSAKDLLNEPPVSLGTIVVMDYHDIREASLFEDLPSAVSLKNSGFKSVRIGLESGKFGKTYKPSDLLSTYHASLSDISKSDQDYLKKSRKKAYSIMKSGFVHSLATKALFNKINDYRNAGVPVTITGLESVDRSK